MPSDFWHAREDRPADEIHREIDAFAAGRLEHLRAEILAARADADVEPERAQPLELRGRARNADHVGAENFAELDRRDADARRRARDSSHSPALAGRTERALPTP